MILSRYKSGPLPKPFKILPTIPHWEEILQLTQPEHWYASSLGDTAQIADLTSIGPRMLGEATN